MEQSDPKRDGLIFSGHASETSRYMEGHGLATIFLAGFYREETDETRKKKLHDVLTRAVQYIGKAQSSQGGWYHTSKMEGHDLDEVLTTVIQIQALQAAENAGIVVRSSNAMRDAQTYLETRIDKYEKANPVGQQYKRATDTAGALCCGNSYLGEVSVQEKRLAYCKAEVPIGAKIKFGRDELANFYYAQALAQVGEDSWTAYRTATFDHLQSSQNKDGSWPGSDGLGVGPIYATALWCTVLQLDTGNHPSRRIYEPSGRIF
jgi:hypothetical protein